MRMREFIRNNRQVIDEVIKRVTKLDTRINDAEREMWVMNDEGLYQAAASEGVKRCQD